jgi:hypothetical protein
VKRLVVFVVIAIGLGTAGVARSATPKPSIVPSRTTCVAPCSVYFDATQSDSNGDGVAADWFPDLVDATFAWNFGDATAAGKSWAYGPRATTSSALSKNVDMGFVAAHLFEQPGTYTVQLRITNSTGAQASATTAINVSAWNNSTNGPTYCFSTSGTFTGCPSGSTQVTQSNFTTAVNQCTSSGARHARCIFRGGESFTSSGSVSVKDGTSAAGTIVAGGAALYGFGTGHAIITGSDAPGARTGIAVFDFRWTNGGGPGGNVSKTHILVWNNEVSCTNCGSAFPTDRGNYNFLIDNYMHDMAGYCWGDYIQQYGAQMGNACVRASRSLGSDHDFRNAAPTMMIMSHNYAQVDNPTYTGWKLNATDNPTGTPTFHVWFYDNECAAASNSMSCVEYGPQYGGINEPVKQGVFDSNFLHMLSGFNVPYTGFDIVNCDSCVLRNNVFQSHDNGNGSISIKSFSGSGSPAPGVNNAVVGNSAWNTAGSNCTISMVVAGAVSNTTIRDNLSYLANGSCSIVSCGGTANCTNDHNLRATSKPFTGGAPTTLDAFRLAAGSSPIGQGVSTSGLLIDAVGTARDATPDLGAYEHSTGVAQGPPPPPVLMSGQ